jgi:formate hydrogenlyase subunit 5
MKNQAVNPENKVLYRICQQSFSQDSGQDVYLTLLEADFLAVVPQLPDMEILLIGLFAVQDFNGYNGFSLLYVLEKRGSRNNVVLVRRLNGQETTSVALTFPSAGWFEREVRDGFGIVFQDAFDTRRLFLHDVYPAKFHPLLKSFHNHELTLIEKAATGPAYQFKEVEGEGVYNVLVGPVHAGIIEPGHFHFSVIGETIANLEVRMFYKHRGIEKLAEGRTPYNTVVVAETISGDESAANAVAFCMAIEKIADVKVPQKAWILRTILLEMERVYSHLGDLGGMLVDVAFALGATEFSVLREELLRYNEILTGSRFLKGIICPGGLRKDITTRNLLLLTDYLEASSRRFQKAVSYVHKLDSVLDRLETTGVIRPELIVPLNITGPAARAAGETVDTRLDHPYGIYAALGLDIRTAEKGDVLSRFDVKCAEIYDSITIIQTLIADINQLRNQQIRTECPAKDGYALALVEAPRGQNLHWVYLKNGLIERYKVRTASFCNWQAAEHAVMGNIVPDFPLINKSLNLSYAGTDL